MVAIAVTAIICATVVLIFGLRYLENRRASRDASKLFKDVSSEMPGSNPQ